MAAESQLSKPDSLRHDGGNQTGGYSSVVTSLAASWNALAFDLDDALSWPVVNSPTGSNRWSNPTMPESIVSGMPTVTDGGVCAICMEKIGASSCGKRMPCAHVYHGACISEWLVRNVSCPLCRCQIRPE